jgi:hypothetical protein
VGGGGVIAVAVEKVWSTVAAVPSIEFVETSRQW